MLTPLYHPSAPLPVQFLQLFVYLSATLMKSVMTFYCGWNTRQGWRYLPCFQLESLLMEGRSLLVTL
ncbi:hypothetical protein H5410_030930 [Solanum commersonii]|uniref:Uncharacterized protein n=1 Tax=Solanum commersonii TaxID=4109 RepID=A0A9J5YIT9_SOLCO|nr:hypothetical protein H5410_030930 [Solanum commersonii]